MIRRPPIELPPEVARRFFEEHESISPRAQPIKRDEIAARQVHALQGFVPIDRKLRLSDIKELFEQMRDLAETKKPPIDMISG